MKQVKWEYMLTVVFSILSVLLLVVIVLQFNFAEQFRVERINELKHIQSAGFAIPAMPHYQFNELALVDYDEVVERPLFFKDRRPVVVSDDGEEDVTATVVTKAPDKVGLNLIGIIKAPSGAYALFENPKVRPIRKLSPKEERFSRFKQNDEIDGWLLKEIGTDRVKLVSGDFSEELLLAKPRAIQTVIPHSNTARNAQQPASNTSKAPVQNPFKRQNKPQNANPFAAIQSLPKTNPFKPN